MKMSKYYKGKRAEHYNIRWRALTERTLAETLAMVDFAALSSVPERLGRSPRILDVGCGTGILLKKILERVPNAEAYGIDASEDMLAQAYLTLSNWSNVRLEQIEVVAGQTLGLPYLPQFFDLITCTNMLHYVSDPTAVLAGLRRLLVPGGYLVIEDYSRPEPPFPWSILEWLAQRFEGQQVRKHTLVEAELQCNLAGLHIEDGKTFIIDWLWRGWVLRLSTLAHKETDL